MKSIELTPEMQYQKANARVSLITPLLGLLLLGVGYWAVSQAIILSHRAINRASAYIIQIDIAQTGLKGKMDERVVYSTALKLDRCLDSLEQVRESIAPLPLGGPEAQKN